MTSTAPSPSSTVHPSPSATPRPAPPAAVIGSTTTPLTEITHQAAAHSAIFALFDTGKLAGFPLPKPTTHAKATAVVWELQSRLGAGNSLVGYLNAAPVNAVVTALLSGSTLPLLIPSLGHLGKNPADGKRLIIHLSLGVPSEADALAKPSNSLAQIEKWLSILPSDFTVVFSGSPEEIIQNTAEIHNGLLGNVLHVFDGVFASRETVRTLPATKLAEPIEPFVYTGSPSAQKVVVSTASYVSTVLASGDLPASVGRLQINLLNQTEPALIQAVLPPSVNELIVFDQVESASEGTPFLKEAVLGNLFGQAGSSRNRALKVTGITVASEEPSFKGLLFAAGLVAPPASSAGPLTKQTLLFTSQHSLLPNVLAKTFLEASPALQTKISTLTSTAPALAQTTLLVTPSSKRLPPLTSVPKDDTTDFVLVNSLVALTQTKSALRSLKQNATVLVSLPGWDKASAETNFTPADKALLRAKNVRLFVLPAPLTALKLTKEEAEIQEVGLGLVGFLLLYAGIGENGVLPDGLRAVVEGALGEDVARDLIRIGEQNLKESVVSRWEPASEEENAAEEKRAELILDGLTSFPDLTPTGSSGGHPIQGTWHIPALHLLFKESYLAPPSTDEIVSPEINKLTPSLEEKTYLATVTENRRLTPDTYDRNVFHLELSTAGTGLKYDVGEALGVHGWNDADEVLEFLEWFGIHPDTVLSLPLPSNPAKAESRTAFQLFQQHIDIFGRPPKSFYAGLVSKTDVREDARQLRFISSPEGGSLFKKLGEFETVTFFDVLKRFESVKKGLTLVDLIHLIGEIKPRHYSISSAQKFVGDSVHLLVVTVEWDSSLGKPRFGQCTRYLSGLKIGQKVTVSIKPSVMKLPPLDSQPVIMAGLGTGAAPFRAFIQHRAWQKSQGIEVGPLIYYFGARYSSQEYLYGEEIEAYLAGGLLTHAGLAFSRDTKAKVYIQHKMGEDGELLSSILTAKEEKDKAYFYLCGPTWPVPDVYEALVSSLTVNKGYGRDQAEAAVEEWKEEERYVLEVY
ncbi:NADP/FAD dependent oxidoreductase [Phaffia rhodozyma]|uniref:assimilatory sulfite reductase (NADPH) n=1 Tax=Phaffia rhodozyma TaxID=264483 RepID=A0A0F7SGE2_PHARH|nr:NADP/FAD dependent oxidoreductase [Phaffia rhodozyma]